MNIITCDGIIRNPPQNPTKSSSPQRHKELFFCTEGSRVTPFPGFDLTSDTIVQCVNFLKRQTGEPPEIFQLFHDGRLKTV